MYNTATAFLEALRETGVSHLFANLGSDRQALIESLAEARAEGVSVPRLITCPNEMVALSAAHGYAQVAGQPQAVIVHVECGTQALAGAVHNAAKGRTPVLIFAGMSLIAQAGELPGSRNEFIHWLQDVNDRRAIVRQYMHYDNEIRTGVNVKQLVYRTSAREVPGAGSAADDAEPFARGGETSPVQRITQDLAWWFAPSTRVPVSSMCCHGAESP
jgi:acetolactate synthase-1/2/3 large subunit